RCPCAPPTRRPPGRRGRGRGGSRSRRRWPSRRPPPAPVRRGRSPIRRRRRPACSRVRCSWFPAFETRGVGEELVDLDGVVVVRRAVAALEDRGGVDARLDGGPDVELDEIARLEREQV